MATCNAGNDCTITCSAGCGCAYVPSEEFCFCTCYHDTHKVSGLALNSATLVSIAVSGLPLGRVGLLLDGLLAREVLVPATRTEDKVRIKLDRVRLSEVVKTLGLTTRPRVVTPPRRPGGPRKRSA
jgi:hypothetical protein